MAKRGRPTKKVHLNGFHTTPKTPRTRQEIDNDYNYNALHAGHKLRLIADLEKEILEHTENMKVFNAEGKALFEMERAAAGNGANLTGANTTTPTATQVLS